ncbi:MAG: c-type cytochrome [Zoogloeaceae bacterium]|jgi:cytochrome c553|nr:c-type cytochrome [Zoogloeaceae bacterium]
MKSDVRYLLGVLLAGLSVAVALPVHGADARLQAIRSTPESLRANVQAGKKASFFCVNCHGDSGVSKLPEVPNLAGQNADYVLEQTRKFGDGRRKDAFMQGLIKVLTEEEKVQISLFYAEQKVTPGAQEASLVASGKQVYLKLCNRCHGPAAHGSEVIPRLAGQHPEYLIESVTRYRDKTGQRVDPLMFSAVAPLNNAQIKAVAAYLNTLP